MTNATAINWKKNTQEYFLNQFKKEAREEGIKEAKREIAVALLREGLSHELIERATDIPLAEIAELEAQSA